MPPHLLLPCLLPGQLLLLQPSSVAGTAQSQQQYMLAEQRGSQTSERGGAQRLNSSPFSTEDRLQQQSSSKAKEHSTKTEYNKRGQV